MTRETMYFQNGCKLIDLVTGGDKNVYGYPAGRIINICGDASSGKAQPLYSKVLTPDGWKTMGDIKVGDKVIGLKGKPVDVIGVYPQGKRPIYEFEFQDHTTVRSADSHLWRIQTPQQFRNTKDVGFKNNPAFRIVDTQTIVDYIKKYGYAPQNSIYIPKHEVVEFTEKKLPIHPWLLGILIADGSLTEAENGTVSFSNSEPDIIRKAENIISDIPNHSMSSTKDSRNNAITHRIISCDNTRVEISKIITSYGLNVKSIDKHIPEIYLLGSVNQRIELLQGLFDGDGYASKCGSMEYTTISVQLANDICELVRSLGGMAILRKKTSPFYIKNGKRVYCNDAYTVTICLDNPEWVASSEKHRSLIKIARENKKCWWKWCHAKIIKDVRYIGEEECQCIYLADPDHCYITDGNTVTHNTFLCNEIIADAHYRYGSKFRWMYADCERGYSFDTQTMYGFDIWTPESDAPTTVEEAFYYITKFAESLKKDEFGVYVLDSLDGLTSDEQDERAEERLAAIEKGKEMKGTYGMGKAKYLSQEFFPQLCKVIEDKNILLIIVSQIRDNVEFGSFEKYSRSGGKAMDFYCYEVIWLATAKKIIIENSDTQKAIIGGTNKLKLTKGKIPRPYRECFYTYYYTLGIDNISTGLDYLFDLRTKTGELSVPACKCVEWEKITEGKKPIVTSEVRQWLIDNKWYEGKGSYRETLNKGETIKLDTALAYIKSDPEKKARFDETFVLAMDRDSLIQYIYDNDLEDELNRRVEEKWEAFEDNLKLPRQGKYARFYSSQPESTE